MTNTVQLKVNESEHNPNPGGDGHRRKKPDKSFKRIFYQKLGEDKNERELPSRVWRVREYRKNCPERDRN